ncbi:type II toxin-antitoxin system PemK/MazF family toxin [Microcoleus sp. B4-C1]|uniref:type II toxin-antitoxin system PemK/MazF family toxin n=1 Tax=Microcoleus sp. B4-C1 TaxID=2818660 RepID=UPI002FD17A8F
MTTNSLFPKRGDIWFANFDPTVGAEIKKVRPSVVVSSDSVGKLPLKLAAPITDWKEYYAGNIWHIKIDPDIANGLTKVSAVDLLQLRGMDVQRFIRKIGELSTTDMEEIARAIAAVVEYQ